MTFIASPEDCRPWRPFSAVVVPTPTTRWAESAAAALVCLSSSTVVPTSATVAACSVAVAADCFAVAAICAVLARMAATWPSSPRTMSL
ncbi:MAG: hypothetical protein QM765_40690 [Myxococcales bacterium]